MKPEKFNKYDCGVQTMNAIIRRPGEWKQLNPKCGSGGCFCGHYVFRADGDGIGEYPVQNRFLELTGFSGIVVGNFFWGYNTMYDLYQLTQRYFAKRSKVKLLPLPRKYQTTAKPSRG